MTKGVRVIVTVQFPSAEIAEGASAQMVEAFRGVKDEPGAVQYELFRSLEDPAKIVLLELWSSKELYDQHWQAQLARDGAPDMTPNVALEFYQHTNYQILDSTWQPVDAADRIQSIRWA